jgi:hypothetical protein
MGVWGMGAWEYGSMGAWGHWSMGAWGHGGMGVWGHGGMGACEGVIWVLCLSSGPAEVVAPVRRHGI